MYTTILYPYLSYRQTTVSCYQLYAWGTVRKGNSITRTGMMSPLKQLERCFFSVLSQTCDIAG